MKALIVTALFCFAGTTYAGCPGGVCSLNKNKVVTNHPVNKQNFVKQNVGNPVVVYNTFPSNVLVKESSKNLNTVNKGNCRCYRCGCN